MGRSKKYIIGNWKMNLDMHEASLYIHRLSKLIRAHRDVEVVLAPSIFTLQSLSLQVNYRQFKLAAQNFYWRDHGAFTGEVSASQLRGIVQYALVGHSERRYIFYESDKDIRNKVAAAIRNNIKPILCVGETAWERASGETQAVLHDQLIGGLSNITSDELRDVIIAYEPVWAIGAHKVATRHDIVMAVRAIRKQLGHLYGQEAADQTAILYGGSVSSDTAVDILAIPEIDGLLMGNASIDAYEFSEIVKKAHSGSEGVK
jgi:triosephosphate isomerase (TIM)